MPLEEYLPADNLFGNRLDDLAQAYRSARESALESRQYNRRRLNARANVQTSLWVGDTVTVTVDEPVGKLTSIWDPEYEVIRVRGTTHWLHHQQTGKERKLQREADAGRPPISRGMSCRLGQGVGTEPPI